MAIRQEQSGQVFGHEVRHVSWVIARSSAPAHLVQHFNRHPFCVRVLALWAEPENPARKWADGDVAVCTPGEGQLTLASAFADIGEVLQPAVTGRDIQPVEFIVCVGMAEVLAKSG